MPGTRGALPARGWQNRRRDAANLAQLIDGERAAGAAPPGEPAQTDAPQAGIQPVSGLRLGLRALWSSITRVFRR